MALTEPIRSVLLGAVVVILLGTAAVLNSDYYAPRKGELAQPKPAPTSSLLAQKRGQLPIEVTSELIKQIKPRQASLATLTDFYGLDPRSSMPCSVVETFGAGADPKVEASRPLNEGEQAILCLN